MSCFSCCEEDDIHKASDTGPFVANHSAGNSVPFLYFIENSQHFLFHPVFTSQFGESTDCSLKCGFRGMLSNAFIWLETSSRKTSMLLEFLIITISLVTVFCP